jgi:hypothetical protein
VAVVVVALAAAGVVGRGDPSTPDPEPATGAAEESREPVAVTSDAPRYADLAELVAASDLVVRGEVEATERGRAFGGPGGAAIVSRLVRLRVDEVLAGPAPVDAVDVLVEEEGWLDDGRPLAVDGAAPTEVGDRGIWFLLDVGDPELPVYTVVNAEGRYLEEEGGSGGSGGSGDGGGGLVGAEGDDPLVAEVEALSADELAAEVSRLAP